MRSIVLPLMFFSLARLGFCLENTDSKEVSGMPSCGAASTFAFLRLIGKDVSVTEVESWYEKELLSLADLHGAMDQNGIATRSLRIMNPNYETVIAPAIIYVSARERPGIGHFLVLERSSPHGVMLLDASLPQEHSRRKVTWEEFRAR